MYKGLGNEWSVASSEWKKDKFEIRNCMNKIGRQELCFFYFTSPGEADLI